MSVLQVKIKKLHQEAVIPSRRDGDAGFDLTAVSEVNKEGYTEYKTGLAFEIPPGHVGLLFPRSSISTKRMSLCNSVGVLDSSYRGEVTFRFKPSTTGAGKYQPGDRVGQLVIIPYPEVEFQEVEDLSDTERGTGGYGSTNGI